MIIKERVVQNSILGHPRQGLYKMVLSGQIARIAKPGQFVHIQVSKTYDPLLRRPLSIAWINKEREEITLLYRVKGIGTELLTKFRENEHISVLGPLGRGFTVPLEGELLLVAGGIGMFPLYSLFQEVRKSYVKVKLFWGGENREFLESAQLDHLRSDGVDCEVSTMDGSLGHKGLVTDLLERYLANLPASTEGLKRKGLLRAAACGPKGMMRAVAAICKKYGIPLEVSLEERMGCGVGACLGCVCTVKDENGVYRRKRVCKEGPVFDGEEVVWDAGF